MTKPKKEYFIKYNSIEIIPQPGYDLNDETNEYPICEVEFQLNDKILIENREYIQLINTLGEVGGLMQIIHSFFALICSFTTDILYQKTIANYLFSFDINRKIILIKKRKNLSFNFIKDNNEKEEKNIYNKIILSNTSKKPSREKLSNLNNNNNNIGLNDINSGNTLINKNNPIVDNYFNKHNKLDNYDNHLIKRNLKYLNKNSNEIIYKRTNKSKLYSINNNENDWIINKINLTDALISKCFCFKRKKRNVYKLLLNETMNVIMEKLDIFNLFRDLCSIENSKDDCSLGKIKMSKEFSNNLQDLEI